MAFVHAYRVPLLPEVVESGEVALYHFEILLQRRAGPHSTNEPEGRRRKEEREEV